MLQERLYSGQSTFFEKLKSVDFLLILIVIIIGVVSCFAMYSTDGGNVLYYTKSHIIRFGIFFLLFLVMSFIHTRFWYTLGYIFYAISLFMLVWALYFGVSVSGSQRWIDLYFLNFQPSELMKIAIIVCFSKYYHRVQSSDVQHIKYIIQPIVLLILPIFLVISQPDLGTSILIALTGISVMWLAGLNVKYFVYSALLFLVTAPFVISILKPYQKVRILTLSMGSGSDCDGQYLFGNDILGYTSGHVPRHARIYRNFKKEYERLQKERVDAFKEFHEDTINKNFNDPKITVQIEDKEFDKFLELAEKI